MNFLTKSSGDLIKDERLYKLPSIAGASDRSVLVVGGGTQITETLKKNGIKFKFGPFGREIKSYRGRYLAWMVLREQKALAQKKLRERGIIAEVDIPVKKEGKIIYHFNADWYAIALSVNFDRVFIVTLKERDKSFINDLPKTLRKKIEIVYL